MKLGRAATAWLGVAAGALVAGLLAGLLWLAQPTRSGHDPLTGTAWRLTAWSLDLARPASVEQTLVFDDQGDEPYYSGFAGINNFRGRVTVALDGQVEFGPAIATLIGGPDRVMTVETAYLQALAAVTSYRLSGDDLTLIGPDAIQLSFLPA
ncbi:MAG: META domain-containing protein [Propionibacteriaceae bacterium]|nr:META domain-containing protein [Propionibacteriaceae bacterium]